MAIAPGMRFGPYEVAEPIGSGGMGEVYRATDTSLKRDVAIKVLPETFVTDANRLARFQREAEVLASLNHVNIAHVYGLEKSGRTHALVMELVAGPTLAERIAQGPLPIDEALNVALQIADALEAAHEQGIVHRDLKPANAKLKSDGTVKVLDFGIAKALDTRTTSGPQAPALTTPAMTEAGMVLGTAAYMSPEQARGKTVDRRADIWAFGCVLYEMLTGQPAFGGEDVTITLARVLERDTDMSVLPAGLPPAVRQTLKLCLQKDLKKRIRDIGDVRLALRGEFPSAEAAAGARSFWWRALPVSAAALAAGALLAGAAVWSLMRPTPPAPAAVARFLVTPPPTAPLASLGGFDVAISPDGTRLAYVARDLQSGGFRLYVRNLDDLEVHAVPGTEVQAGGNVSPFFSPDGGSIGFNSPGRGIMRVAVDGGSLIKIVDSPAAFGGAAWTTGDTLIYSSALHRVSARGGGTPEPLTPTSEAPAMQVAPRLLPGGRAVLFGVYDASGVQNVTVLDLETGDQSTVIENGREAAYAPTGHLVFARNGTLMAVPFDLDRLAVTGEPAALLQGVRHPARSAAEFAISETGTLIYVPDVVETVTSALVWVDRNGRLRERAISESVENVQYFRLSADEGRLALSSGRSNARELWIYHLDGRPPLPLANDYYNGVLVWSPDDTRVAFSSNRGGTFEIYTLPANGSVLEPRPLRPGGFRGAPYVWSGEGELIVRRESNANVDIVAISVDAEDEAREVVATEDLEDDPDLAPNGRWLAYISDRTGRPEVWVRPYPDGVSIPISRGGAREPVWSPDGRELFYLEGNAMMAVPVRTEDADFSFDPPVQLFDAQSYVISTSSFLSSYDVARDGRFLMLEPSAGAGDAAGMASIVVVQNWFEELKRRVPSE